MMNRRDGALIAGVLLFVTAADRLEDSARDEFISEMQRVLVNARRKVADGRSTAQMIVGTALLAHVVYTSMRGSRSDATIAPTAPLGPRPGDGAWVPPTRTDRRCSAETSGPPDPREWRTLRPLRAGRTVRR